MYLYKEIKFKSTLPCRYLTLLKQHSKVDSCHYCQLDRRPSTVLGFDFYNQICLKSNLSAQAQFMIISKSTKNNDNNLGLISQPKYILLELE